MSGDYNFAIYPLSSHDFDPRQDSTGLDVVFKEPAIVMYPPPLHLAHSSFRRHQCQNPSRGRGLDQRYIAYSRFFGPFFFVVICPYLPDLKTEVCLPRCQACIQFPGHRLPQPLFFHLPSRWSPLFKASCSQSGCRDCAFFPTSPPFLDSLNLRFPDPLYTVLIRCNEETRRR